MAGLAGSIIASLMQTGSAYVTAGQVLADFTEEDTQALMQLITYGESSQVTEVAILVAGDRNVGSAVPALLARVRGQDSILASAAALSLMKLCHTSTQAVLSGFAEMKPHPSEAYIVVETLQELFETARAAALHKGTSAAEEISAAENYFVRAMKCLRDAAAVLEAARALSQSRAHGERAFLVVIDLLRYHWHEDEIFKASMATAAFFPDDIDSVIEAMSKNLRDIAEHIDTHINPWARGRDMLYAICNFLRNDPEKGLETVTGLLAQPLLSKWTYAVTDFLLQWKTKLPSFIINEGTIANIISLASLTDAKPRTSDVESARKLLAIAPESTPLLLQRLGRTLNVDLPTPLRDQIVALIAGYDELALPYLEKAQSDSKTKRVVRAIRIKFKDSVLMKLIRDEKFQ